MGDRYDMSGDYRGSEVYVKSTVDRSVTYQMAPPQPVEGVVHALDHARRGVRQRVVEVEEDRLVAVAHGSGGE